MIVTECFEVGNFRVSCLFWSFTKNFHCYSDRCFFLRAPSILKIQPYIILKLFLLLQICCSPHKLCFPSAKSENILIVTCFKCLFSKALSPLFLMKKTSFVYFYRVATQFWILNSRSFPGFQVIFEGFSRFVWHFSRFFFQSLNTTKLFFLNAM